MLFKPTPFSIPLSLLGEGQKVQIGTVGMTPVFDIRSYGELYTEIGDIASFKTGVEPIEQWVGRLQRRHPEIRF